MEKEVDRVIGRFATLGIQLEEKGGHPSIDLKATIYAFLNKLTTLRISSLSFDEKLHETYYTVKELIESEVIAHEMDYLNKQLEAKYTEAKEQYDSQCRHLRGLIESIEETMEQDNRHMFSSACQSPFYSTNYTKCTNYDIYSLIEAEFAAIYLSDKYTEKQKADLKALEPEFEKMVMLRRRNTRISR